MTFANPVAIPPAPAGWFDYQYYLLSDGALAILRTDRDIHSDYAEWWGEVQDGKHYPLPDLWSGKARLSTLTADGESPAITVPLKSYPLIDRFSDGRWLVASSRTEQEGKNATILHPDGRPSHSLALGDGIEHVRCAPDGTLWVGYFDEGIFGNTLGSGGIVRFDASGKPEWSYNDQNRTDGGFIDDCYAMTLCGRELWTCYYSDFPIARIADDREVRWKNPITGAKALAVEDGYALLAGGYGTTRTGSPFSNSVMRMRGCLEPSTTLPCSSQHLCKAARACCTSSMTASGFA